MSAYIPDPTTLLACPFCGGAASSSVFDDESLFSHNSVPIVAVGCYACGVEFSSELDGYAAEQWNCRKETKDADNEHMPGCDCKSCQGPASDVIRRADDFIANFGLLSAERTANDGAALVRELAERLRAMGGER